MGFLLALLLLLPVSEGPYHVAIADIDGDGAVEAILACRGELRPPTHARPGNDRVSVHFGRPAVRRDYAVGFGPYTSAVADLDRDGRPDVAVANFQEPGGRDLSVLWGRSGDDPLAPAQHLRVEGGPHAYDKNRTDTGEPIYPAPGLTSLAIADFNGDGRPDIAAVAWSSDFLVTFVNRGGRRFRQRRFPLSPGPRDLVAADFDGDGVQDLAITIYSSNLVEVLRGNGRGGFALWRRFHAQGDTPYHLKAGDVDGDGRIDLVVGNRGLSDNVVYFRNGPGGFAYQGAVRGEPGTRNEFRDVLLTDIDGDGRLDLVAAGLVSHRLVLWRGTGASGFGKAFGPPAALPYPGKGPRALAIHPAGIAVAFYDSSEYALVPLHALRAALKAAR